MADPSLFAQVSDYYTGKLRAHGETAQGVDWKDEVSQALRFEQLVKLLPLEGDYLVLDYGCGYGALLDYLRDKGYGCRYLGLDVSPEMVAVAAKRHAADARAKFRQGVGIPAGVDYILCSGVFNVRLGRGDEEWQAYLMETLRAFAAAARRGFAFNLLTTYADKDKMRPDLHYADPCRLFDWAKREVSRHVALLHDYGLYEFTLIVRKILEE